MSLERCLCELLENFANKQMSPHFDIFFGKTKKLELESSFKKVYLPFHWNYFNSIYFAWKRVSFGLPLHDKPLQSFTLSLSVPGNLISKPLRCFPSKKWVRNANIPCVHKFLIFFPWCWLKFHWRPFLHPPEHPHSYHKFLTPIQFKNLQC